MDVVVYLHRPDGTITKLGVRPTDDPRPYCLANIAHAYEITRASGKLIGKDSRLVTKVEDSIGHFEPVYQHAAPAIRHALVYAADRTNSARNPTQRHLNQGQFNGLALALEIMLNSDDTEATPGIAWPHLLPEGALDHTRRMLFPIDNAHWILGLPLA